MTNAPLTRDDGRPTVAVLPFLSAAEEGVLAEGLHEDICSELTRFRGLRVIAPASAAAVGSEADGMIAETLGATHVLRGRLRRQDGGLGLTLTLADARAGVQVWGERLHVTGSDPDDLGGQVVARIAATLNVRLEEAVLTASRRHPAAGLAAYELTVRGLKLVREGTLDADEAARACFVEALKLDPLLARAHAGIALSWFNEWSCQFWSRFDEASRKAYAHAHEALELDDSDAMVHLVLAKVALFRSAWEQAAWYLDRALSLCPHDSDVLAQSAVLDVYLGRPEEALERLDLACRLHPHHPAALHVVAAFAHAFAGDFEKAIACRALSDAIPFVDAPAYIAFAYARLGRVEEARVEYARYLDAYREKIAFGAAFDPGAPRAWLFEVNPFRREEDIAFLRDGFDRLEAPASPSSSAVAAPDEARGILAHAGAGWIVEYGGRRAVLPGLRGLADLRQLLARPGEDIHCLDLAGRQVLAPGGAVLDEKARAAVKARLRDLREEIEDAESDNDSGRAERAREEHDRLVAALSAALGIGGRARRLGDQVEKARTAVTWRIRHAVRRVEADHPLLGRHLRNSIRTGTFCRYAPETPIAWTFATGSPPARRT